AVARCWVRDLRPTEALRRAIPAGVAAVDRVLVDMAREWDRVLRTLRPTPNDTELEWAISVWSKSWWPKPHELVQLVATERRRTADQQQEFQEPLPDLVYLSELDQEPEQRQVMGELDQEREPPPEQVGFASFLEALQRRQRAEAGA
ncbi:MAG: hypothetical protein KC621_32510, partial [Myxococcales bacterium]|nr:hypothetical protein [Myxococcales bacterium]